MKRAPVAKDGSVQCLPAYKRGLPEPSTGKMRSIYTAHIVLAAIVCFETLLQFENTLKNPHTSGCAQLKTCIYKLSTFLASLNFLVGTGFAMPIKTALSPPPKQGFSNYPWLSWSSLSLQTRMASTEPASASLVLGLNTCATTPRFFHFLISPWRF